VGVAGSEEKVRWLTGELGFHAALNYKAHDDLRAALAPLCPDGVDVYFDNVGGAVSDAALGLINLRARLVICGQIAQYNAKNPPRGPRPFATLLVRRARAEGFIIFDFKDRFAEAQRRLSTWVEEGQLRVRETVVEGFANVPKAFLGLFSGQNTGKMVVKL
jgi:NADPH-dependent curcumin reductase CurA